MQTATQTAIKTITLYCKKKKKAISNMTDFLSESSEITVFYAFVADSNLPAANQNPDRATLRV